VGVGADAVDVSVEITSPDAGITISAPMSYGTVPQRERVDNAGTPFTVEVDAGFIEDFFTLVVTTFQEGVVNDSLELPVYIGEQDLLFFDDASSGDEAWVASGTGDEWGEVLDDAYSGTICFGDSNGGNGANNTLNYFELDTTFDFTGTVTPSVSFMAKYALEAGDFVELQLTEDEGDNWTTLQTFTLSEPWTSYFISLNNYAESPSVRLRFKMQTDNSIPADGFYFDDFKLANYNRVILETADADATRNIAVTPNPFSNEVSVTWTPGLFEEVPQVALYDVQGRKMKVTVTEWASTLAVSKLDTFAPGVYFLKILSKNEVLQTYKLLKE